MKIDKKNLFSLLNLRILKNHVRYFFIQLRMYKLLLFYRDTKFFCKKYRNICLLFFVITRSCTVTIYQIYFYFEFLYHSLLFFAKIKSRSKEAWEKFENFIHTTWNRGCAMGTGIYTCGALPRAPRINPKI
jgi:hypothetical protein